MTQSELTLAIANVLQGNLPITAVIHRNAEGLIIAELYNATSRGAVLATVTQQGSIAGGDEMLVVRGGATVRIPLTAIGSSNRKQNVIPSGLVNGINLNYTLPDTPAEDTLALYADGDRMVEGVDFNLTGPNIVMITFAPVSAIISDYEI